MVSQPAFILARCKEQKEKYLPKMATGEIITAMAMTESGAGSDLQGMKTTARKVTVKTYTPFEFTLRTKMNISFSDSFKHLPLKILHVFLGILAIEDSAGISLAALRTR